MDAPELIVPIRMDASGATSALKNFGATGAKAGDEVAKGAAKAEGGIKGAAHAVGEFGRQAVAVHGMQLAFSAVGGAVAAMGAEFKNAVDYINTIAKEFVELRQAMQQVAALKGQPNSNEFTVNESRKAFQVSLTPQEWKTFQEQFQSFGGAYLEGDQARFQDREGKSAQTQGEEYQQKIAEFAKSRGIPAADIAQLGGALLQFSEGPQTTEDLMSKLGKVYKTLERAPTPVAQLLPQMSRVMAQGASAEEASQMLAIMSEAMPGEEETGVTNTIKAITNQTLEGKGAALGQEKGMTRVEQIKAAVKAIKARQEKGEDLDAILHEIAPDLREMRGVKGFLTRGLEAEGFERTKGYQEETPADFVEKSIADYEKTDAGRYARAVAKRALTEAEAGSRQAELETLKEEAIGRMTERGDFEEFHLGEAAVRGATSKITGVDSRQQRINAEILADVGRRASDAGVTSLLDPRTAHGRAEIATTSATQDQLTINKQIQELLRQIAESNQKIAEKIKAEEPRGEPGKPISAPPPPSVRNMG
jgi:hypothetical protein